MKDIPSRLVCTNPSYPKHPMQIMKMMNGIPRITPGRPGYISHHFRGYPEQPEHLENVIRVIPVIHGMNHIPCIPRTLTTCTRDDRRTTRVSLRGQPDVDRIRYTDNQHSMHMYHVNIQPMQSMHVYDDTGLHPFVWTEYVSVS